MVTSGTSKLYSICSCRTMYGPILNSQRGKSPEEIDTTTENHALSTHTNGSRSGMPLWGSHRSFNAPPQHLELIEGRISPVMRSDMTVSTAERTSSPASVLEKESFGYVELLSFLPSMQDQAVLARKPCNRDLAHFHRPTTR